MDRRTLVAAAPMLLAAARARGAPAPPALAAYERETGGRVGVFARNLASGASLAWRADERFVMCSTFKASLAALVLRRVERGRERLDRPIRYTAADLQEYAPVARQNLVRGEMSVEEMCAAAVEWSDNTCANLLLASVGGPAALTAFWREIGDRVSRLDHNEPQLNRSPPGDPHDTTTPAAMAATIRRLTLDGGLAPPSRERLIGWMVAGKTGDNRLRAGLPKGWRIGDKTGNNGRDAAGDLAVAWRDAGPPLLIACYVQGGAPTPERIAAIFAEVGRLSAAL